MTDNRDYEYDAYDDEAERPHVDVRDEWGETDLAEDDEDGYSTPLGHEEFDGDLGTLPRAQREAFIALLKNKFVDARTRAEEYRTIAEHPQTFKSRLNDLYLDLYLDTDRNVAFKTQVRAQSSRRFPTLLYATAWSREETLLMVELRRRILAGRMTGQVKVEVDRADLADFLEARRPVSDVDKNRGGRAFETAIGNLHRHDLLIGSKDATRFEINPAVEAVLPVEQLRAIKRWMNPAADATPEDVGTDGITPNTRPAANTGFAPAATAAVSHAEQT